MGRYVARRLALLVPQLLGVLLVTFMAVRLVPGNPAQAQLGSYARPEAIAELDRLLGYDKPVWEQFVSYVGQVVQGDLGQSWFSGNPVVSDIVERLPATVELVSIGLVLALALGVGLAILTTFASGPLARAGERFATGYGLTAGAVPDFWFALILVLVFFVGLGVVPAPVGRIGQDVALSTPTGLYLLDSAVTLNPSAFGSAAGHLLLPVATLVFVAAAAVLRMTRSGLVEALDSEYVWFARANGLPRRTILRYALRNAMLPVITLVGALYGILLAGAVLIEQIFSWNGVGQYAVQAVVRADYAALQGVVLVTACFTLVVFLLMDLLYAAVDPRIKY